MGLDVTAYEHVKLIRRMTVKQAKAERFEGKRNEVLLYVDHPSRTQHDGMIEGVYETSGSAVGVDAGSYTGYGLWREWLARVARGRAFGDLINFADNQGFIGPKTAAKLASDFVEWRKKAVASADLETDGVRFMDLYDDFTKAFVLASHDGTVKFH